MRKEIKVGFKKLEIFYVDFLFKEILDFDGVIKSDKEEEI